MKICIFPAPWLCKSPDCWTVEAILASAFSAAGVDDSSLMLSSFGAVSMQAGCETGFIPMREGCSCRSGAWCRVCQLGSKTPATVQTFHNPEAQRSTFSPMPWNHRPETVSAKPCWNVQSKVSCFELSHGGVGGMWHETSQAFVLQAYGPDSEVLWPRTLLM